MKHITTTQAFYFSQFQGKCLLLTSLTSLTDLQAKYLSYFEGKNIYVLGLKQVSDKQGEYFSKRNGVFLLKKEILSEHQKEILK